MPPPECAEGYKAVYEKEGFLQKICGPAKAAEYLRHALTCAYCTWVRGTLETKVFRGSDAAARPENAPAQDGQH